MNHSNLRSHPPARDARRPRVVMLLANPFVHDTRVSKQARSLADWGCEVHVVAARAPGLPDREVRDGIHVHRVDMRTATWVAACVPLLPLLLFSQWAMRLLMDRADGSDRARRTRGAVSRRVADVVSSLRRLLQGAGRLLRRAPSAIGRWIVFSTRHLTLAVLGPYAGPRVVDRAGRATRKVMSHPAGDRTGRATRNAMFRLRRDLSHLWGLPGRSLSRLFQTSVLRLVGFNLRIARCAVSLQPDVVQAHDLNTLIGGVTVKRLSGAPLVYDSHELFLERNIGDRPRRPDKLTWGPVEWFCIRWCDAVFSVAESICTHLQSRYGIERPHLIRNVQPYVPPPPPSTVLSDELGIPSGMKIVLYPGAITINRGLEVMIDSSPYLDHAVYVIMGYAHNPAFIDKLRQRAEALGVLGTRVFFRDAVPMEDVVRYSASAHLGIVPTQNVCLSYQFELSNKIFHCLMAGIPLAMSDHAEKRLIVQEFGVGVLFDETNPQAIAEAVNGALADSDAYAEMRRNCLRAARVLTWEHEEEKLRRVFAGLLGSLARPVPPVRISGEVEDGHEPRARLATASGVS